MSKGKEQNRAGTSSVFKVGAIALAFLILGYQAALFVHRAAAAKIAANADHPDTVYVTDRALAEEILRGQSDVCWQGAPGGESVQSAPAGHSSASGDKIIIRRNSSHSPEATQIRREYSPRRVENFEFNPNTATIDELMRLGFSEKQARSIEAYRAKGGQFRRPSDFAKSYVVADSVFERLQPFIRIPKTDINTADSAAFDALPGIGGWFAKRMVEYRQQLRGYSCPEQLMQIYNFDRQKYDALKDLITCSAAEPYPLWTAPADTIRNHPHVRSWQTAKAIVLYREHNPREAWTVQGLLDAGVINAQQAEGLGLCKFK